MIRVPAFARRLHLSSFAIGVVFAVASVTVMESAFAFDLGGMAKAASNLVRIKKDLDGDVKALTTDARTLYSDKDNLVQIKEQLVKLATETQAQIESINKLVGTVEGHVKTTQTDISTTSKHVGEIDDVRKALDN